MDKATLAMPNFLELGSWTVQQIKPLFNLFTVDTFATAVGLCFLFFLETKYIRIQIRRRIKAIRTISSKSDFAGAIPRIQALMLNTKYLRHSWEKFRETLIEPEPDVRPNIVLNTSRPQDYFNIVEAGLRFPIYKALPNVLVGVGLLLTFFGLVSALFFTTDAISHATDPKATQDALRDLLHAASFKFYTSIAGLGGSIVLTLVLRHGTSQLEHASTPSRSPWRLNFNLSRQSLLLSTLTEKLKSRQRHSGYSTRKLRLALASALKKH